MPTRTLLPRQSEFAVRVLQLWERLCWCDLFGLNSSSGDFRWVVSLSGKPTLQPLTRARKY
jgi:hypothetical protein